MTDKQLVRTLNRLYRLCRAGERGFQVVAQNVSNRGLKVLLKSFAQQRAGFKDKLQEEIERSGGGYSERRSTRGIIHRGRITIRAALTIGPQNIENAVLGEARPGENAVLKAYKRALGKDLPDEIRFLLKQQLHEIQKVSDEVKLLRGRSDQRLVVRLFDSEAAAQTAYQALEEAGFRLSDAETEDVSYVSVYEGVGSTVSETVMSGAFGGALWGALIGLVAGISALFIPQIETMMGVSPLAIWLSIAIAGSIAGALIGAILGFLIGQGAYEADNYLYDDSVTYGTTLLRLKTGDKRATEAAQILHHVNATSILSTGGFRWP